MASEIVAAGRKAVLQKRDVPVSMKARRRKSLVGQIVAVGPAPAAPATDRLAPLPLMDGPPLLRGNR